jgi:hypothetical protein
MRCFDCSREGNRPPTKIVLYIKHHNQAALLVISDKGRCHEIVLSSSSSQNIFPLLEQKRVEYNYYSFDVMNIYVSMPHNVLRIDQLPLCRRNECEYHTIWSTLSVTSHKKIQASYIVSFHQHQSCFHGSMCHSKSMMNLSRCCTVCPVHSAQTMHQLLYQQLMSSSSKSIIDNM